MAGEVASSDLNRLMLSAIVEISGLLKMIEDFLAGEKKTLVFSTEDVENLKIILEGHHALISLFHRVMVESDKEK